MRFTGEDFKHSEGNLAQVVERGYFEEIYALLHIFMVKSQHDGIKKGVESRSGSKVQSSFNMTPGTLDFSLFWIVMIESSFLPGLYILTHEFSRKIPFALVLPPEEIVVDFREQIMDKVKRNIKLFLWSNAML